MGPFYLGVVYLGMGFPESIDSRKAFHAAILHAIKSVDISLWLPKYTTVHGPNGWRCTAWRLTCVMVVEEVWLLLVTWWWWLRPLFMAGVVVVGVELLLLMLFPCPSDLKNISRFDCNCTKNMKWKHKRVSTNERPKEINGNLVLLLSPIHRSTLEQGESNWGQHHCHRTVESKENSSTDKC